MALFNSKDTLFQKFLVVFEQLLLVGLISAFVYLMIMAFKIQYTDYSKKYPLRFLFELIAFSALPAFPLFVFMLTRGLPLKVTLTWFAILWAKFAFLHLLFEFSGIYQYYFGNNIRL